MINSFVFDGILGGWKDGEPWFVGHDIAKALEYGDSEAAIERYVDEKDKCYLELFDPFPAAPGGNQKQLCINELGVYCLAWFRERPEAMKFFHWLIEEALPKICEGNSPVVDTNKQNKELLDLAQQVVDNQDKRIAELELENTVQKMVIADMNPVRQYIDCILDSRDTCMTTAQIAKEYELSEEEVNQILFDECFLRKVNGEFVLPTVAMGLGYTTYELGRTIPFDSKAYSEIEILWTQKGRLKIHEILTNKRIFTRMDKEYMGALDVSETADKDTERETF